MKFPFASFLIAIIIWGFCIAIFAYFSFQESAVIPATLEVDASIVDEVPRRVESKNSARNDLQKVKKISQEKILEEAHEKQAEKPLEKSISNPSNPKLEKIATITARPLPEIPEELRQEAFNNYAIARFYIAADGSATVDLIKPCNNPRLNQLLLQSLRKWKFIPAHAAGIAATSTQDVKVNFKVE